MQANAASTLVASVLSSLVAQEKNTINVKLYGNMQTVVSFNRECVSHPNIHFANMSES